MKHSVTIRDIAKSAGVSIATVSRTLNQSDTVSEETRQKVLSAVEQQGYRPKTRASSRPSDGSRIITMLYDAIPRGGATTEDSLGQSQHASILSAGIQDVLMGTEFHLRVVILPRFLHSSTETEIGAWMDQTGALEGSAGLILTNPVVHDYLAEYIVRRELPGIVVGNCPMPAPIPQIDVDNVDGFRVLTAYVLGLGHRDVAYLGPDVDVTVHQDRIQGFREAFAQHGLVLPPAYWIKTEPKDFVSSFRDARTRMLEVIDSGRLPSAIMAFNDEMAYGVIQALTARRIVVPQDVSVTGFDDLPSSAMYSPALTTVHQDTRLIGQHACRALLRQMDGHPSPALTVLPVRLIVRESTQAYVVQPQESLSSLVDA